MQAVCYGIYTAGEREKTKHTVCIHERQKQVQHKRRQVYVQKHGRQYSSMAAAGMQAYRTRSVAGKVQRWQVWQRQQAQVARCRRTKVQAAGAAAGAAAGTVAGGKAGSKPIAGGNHGVQAGRAGRQAEAGGRWARRQEAAARQARRLQVNPGMAAALAAQRGGCHGVIRRRHYTALAGVRRGEPYAKVYKKRRQAGRRARQRTSPQRYLKGGAVRRRALGCPHTALWQAYIAQAGDAARGVAGIRCRTARTLRQANC